MRNRLTPLLICVLIAVCPARSYGAEGPPDGRSGGPVSEISAADEANITNLQDMEKGIQFLADKLMRREIDLKKRAEYEGVRVIEMKKCAVLKSEIWALRDSARALIAKLNKLSADKGKCEADIAKDAEIYRVSEENIRVAAGTISARDRQFKDLMATNGKDSDSRGDEIDKLKENLKASAGKIEMLQNEKNKLEGDLRDKDVEYKAETGKLRALKDRLAAEKKESLSLKKGGPPAKEDVPVKDESADIRKNMDELMATIGKGEASRYKLTIEINAATAANKLQKERIAALEKEDELRSKDLKARAEDMEKAKKKTLAKIEKLKKKALLAKAGLSAARAADKKLEDDMKKATQEKRRAEKEFKIKTDDLKVRISVLLGEGERDNLLNESPGEAQAKKSLSRGEELTIKLDKMFDVMKDENDRLMAENKDTRAKLRRAEQAARAARRKAEQAVEVPDELRVKLDRERVDMHFNLAVVYEKNGLYRDAEREYLKCLWIDPKDAGVHYNIGILYDDKLNRNGQAMYHYRKFLSLRPMGETAERVRDWITKLELENRLGKEMR